MVLQIILLFLLLVGIAYYALYYVPKKNIEKFALQVSQKGYKVKLMLFKFMKYYMVQFESMENGNLRIFKEDIAQYDIVVGYILGKLAIIPVNTNLVKDFYNQLYKLPKNPFISEVYINYLNGGGVLFTQGESWKRKRRIMSSVFHFDFLNDMIPSIEDQIDLYAKQIQQLIEKDQTINLQIIFVKILASVIAKCFFGTDLRQYRIEGRFFSDCFLQYLQQVNAFAISPDHAMLGMLGPRYGLTKRCRDLNKKLKIFYQISKQVTLKQIQKVKNKQVTKKNLISTLYESGMLNLGQKSTPQQYSIEQLIGQFFAFVGAGSDSSSHALNLAFHYLSQNSQLKQRVRKQADEAFNSQNIKQVDKLKKLVLTQAVFNQTLRINGPISEVIPRISSQQITLGDLKIPKGTSFNVLPIVNHYRKEYFPNPDKFLPERWMNDPKIEPFSFMPFGGGERVCIGQYLAKIQGKLIISKLVKRFDFESLKPISMKKRFFYITEFSQFNFKQRSK